MTPARVIRALMMEREGVSTHRIDLRSCPDLWNPIYASTGKEGAGRRRGRVTRMDRESTEECDCSFYRDEVKASCFL